jgi:hypothetical protein
MLPAKRFFALGACAFMLLLLATTARAAPLSPSAQFAYNVAANATPPACAVEAQIVPAFASPSIVAEYDLATCSIGLSRELADGGHFAKSCKVFTDLLRIFDGREPSTRLPRTCLMHDLFLLNHPHYLERRFR